MHKPDVRVGIGNARIKRAWLKVLPSMDRRLHISRAHVLGMPRSLFNTLLDINAR